MKRLKEEITKHQFEIAIQAAIGSGANTHYRFGRFESAIGHLHKNLALYLTQLDKVEGDVMKGTNRAGADKVDTIVITDNK